MASYKKNQVEAISNSDWITLSTLSSVDYIAILEQGRLVDFGSREQIVNSSAYYARVRDLLAG